MKDFFYTELTKNNTNFIRFKISLIYRILYQPRDDIFPIHKKVHQLISIATDNNTLIALIYCTQILKCRSHIYTSRKKVLAMMIIVRKKQEYNI